HVHFDRYGGRGISGCEKWTGSDGFGAFITDMGNRPSPLHQIYRIDNNGNYEPGNCRWVTSKDNGRNKRNNRLVTIDGDTMPVSSWAEMPGAVGKYRIFSRLNMGWDHRSAVFHPVGVPR